MLDITRFQRNVLFAARVNFARVSAFFTYDNCMNIANILLTAINFLVITVVFIYCFKYIMMGLFLSFKQVTNILLSISPLLYFLSIHTGFIIDRFQPSHTVTQLLLLLNFMLSAFLMPTNSIAYIFYIAAYLLIGSGLSMFNPMVRVGHLMMVLTLSYCSAPLFVYLSPLFINIFICLSLLQVDTELNAPSIAFITTTLLGTLMSLFTPPASTVIAILSIVSLTQIKTENIVYKTYVTVMALSFVPQVLYIALPVAPIVKLMPNIRLSASIFFNLHIANEHYKQDNKKMPPLTRPNQNQM